MAIDPLMSKESREKFLEDTKGWAVPNTETTTLTIDGLQMSTDDYIIWREDGRVGYGSEEIRMRCEVRAIYSKPADAVVNFLTSWHLRLFA